MNTNLLSIDPFNVPYFSYNFQQIKQTLFIDTILFDATAARPASDGLRKKPLGKNFTNGQNEITKTN